MILKGYVINPKDLFTSSLAVRAVGASLFILPKMLCIRFVPACATPCTTPWIVFRRKSWRYYNIDDEDEN